MEYAGLVTIRTHKHIGTTVSETSAAFAGMGYGLCEHYNNCDTCENEEADMPHHMTLALSFTHESFSASYIYMQSAYRNNADTEEIHFDLGFKHLSASQNDHPIYWTKIRDTIIRVGRTAPAEITELLLLGEDANNKMFLAIVQDALRELIPEIPPNMRTLFLESQVTFDPTFIAARGAAEFAKRSLGAPPICREPPRCEENRLMSTMDNESERPEL
jgi:hypothetical protein